MNWKERRSHSSPLSFEHHVQPPHRRPLVSKRQSRRAIVAIVALSFVTLARFSYHFSRPTQQSHLDAFAKGLGQCNIAIAPDNDGTNPNLQRRNPRWTINSGQQTTKVLSNATLFDGDTLLTYAVDIHFARGIIVSVLRPPTKHHFLWMLKSSTCLAAL